MHESIEREVRSQVTSAVSPPCLADTPSPLTPPTLHSASKPPSSSTPM